MGRFGYAVAWAGDVNGDGFTDALIGQPGYGCDTGEAQIFFGGPGFDDVADVLLRDAAMGRDFGAAVAAAGDLNGDGYADVLIAGTPYDYASYCMTFVDVFLGGPNPDGVQDLAIPGFSTGSCGRAVPLRALAMSMTMATPTSSSAR